MINITIPGAVGAGELHLWISDPNAIRHEIGLEGLMPLLDDRERQVSESLTRDDHQAEYVVSHALCRAALAGYLDLPSDAVRYGYNDAGKPLLASASELGFNISYTGGVAVCVFGQSHELGVDIEHIENAEGLLSEAEQYLADFEVRQIRQLAQEDRGRGFFRHWTAKEALIKARGQGQSLKLHEFGVEFLPDGTRCIVHEEMLSPDWQFWVYELDANYTCAVAFRGTPSRIRLFRWSPQGVAELPLQPWKCPATEA